MQRIPLWIRVAFWVGFSTLAVAVVFAAGYATCWFLQPETRYPIGNVPEAQADRFRVFWEAWNVVERDFYDPDALDPQEMTYGAIRGMVQSVEDPYTNWLEPAAGAILREDITGSFEGIGATVNNVDGMLTIVGTLPGSPALSAGLKAGDVILEADGQALSGLDVFRAVSIIRGPAGTSVELTIRRMGPDGIDEFIVSVERAKLDFPTVAYEILPSGIALLQLNEFNARATDELRRALDELLAEDPPGLILDLRNNPGGLLSSAVEVASEFIDEGVILIERGSPEDEGTEYRARRGGRATEIPLVILVNELSASASEIVAGAVQDHERGVLIGETTFGKGSVQLPQTLSDDSYLVVTIAHWFTPGGHQIEGRGLAPDIAVPVSEEDREAGRDPQLDRAVQYLRDKR